MRILVSNDDGYFAPGIAALAEALATLGDVTVVAPERDVLPVVFVPLTHSPTDLA